jgi:hypothetical protein
VPKVIKKRELLNRLDARERQAYSLSSVTSSIGLRAGRQFNVGTLVFLDVVEKAEYLCMTGQATVLSLSDQALLAIGRQDGLELGG